MRNAVKAVLCAIFVVLVQVAVAAVVIVVQVAAWALVAFLVLALLAAMAHAQAPAPTPDHRGEVVTTTPSWRGETTSAAMPVEVHVRNELDAKGRGHGMCVPSTVLAQKVPGFDVPGEGASARPGDHRVVADARGKGSPFWRAAKEASARGYGPDSLAKLLEETMPGVKYTSWLDASSETLDFLSRKKYVICALMNTGAFYGYADIDHMVNVPHYRLNGMACVVDNNDPGRFHWMPSSEYDRRRRDGPFRWTLVLNYLPPAAPDPPSPKWARPAIAGAAVVMLLATALFCVEHYYRVALARRAQP